MQIDKDNNREGISLNQWRLNSAVFHEKAVEYDQWFDNSLLFEIELQALKDLQTVLHAPKLEVGVGPGRFAGALGVDFGIDPATSPLYLARKRNVQVVRAIGEEIPVADCTMATVFLLFTFCFLADPQKVLNECNRILQPGGHLVLGMVPAGGAWGRLLAEKKKKQHPFYKHASFYSVGKIIAWLEESRFSLVESRSSLYQLPEKFLQKEDSRRHWDECAGFCLLVNRKKT